jgi:hypothetical protein
MLYLGRPNTVANLYSKLMASPEGAAGIADDIRALNAVPADRDSPGGLPAAAAPGPVDSPVAHSSTVVDALRSRLAQLQNQLAAIAAAAQADPRALALKENERAGRQPAAGEYAYGGEFGQIVQCAMQGADGTEKTLFTTGENVEVRLLVRARENFAEPIYAMTIKGRQGQEVYGTNSLYCKQAAPAIHPGEEADVVFRFPLNLIAGEYFLSLGWTTFVGDELLVIHRRYDTIKFTVLGIDRAFGIAHLATTIDVTPRSPQPA